MRTPRLDPSILCFLNKKIAFLVFLLWPVMTHAGEYSRTQLVFGDVLFTITIDCKCSEEKAMRLITNGFTEVNMLNMIFSPYDAKSEFSRVNAASQKGESIRLSRHFAQVLKLAIHSGKLTDGAFDPTFEMQDPSLQDLKLTGRKLAFNKPKMRVNPTGIVKGYAVDQVMKIFKKNRNIKRAVVAGSGDISVYDKNGACQEIALHDPHPKKHGEIKYVTLCNQSVSTSGFYERGRHIRDTAHGKHEHLQVSVVARDTVTSDALDNALFFLPQSRIKRVLEKYAGTKVLVVEKNGNEAWLE